MDEYLKRSIVTRTWFKVITRLYYHAVFKKKFTAIGGPPLVWGIRNIEIFGPNISIGKNVVFTAAKDSRTRIGTVRFGSHEGSVQIGDNVLLMSGIRISSATQIVIGDDCMLANFCYLTDADWHDIHDRTRPIGRTAPIILEKGVWIGDSAIVCKGVRIGQHSIVAIGSVVTKDVPPNVIVAGNPARIVKELDPDKVVTLGALYQKFGGPAG